MAWLFKPDIPSGTTFAGQIMFNMEDLEIDAENKKYISSVGYKILRRFITKHTGFEDYKYNYKDKIEVLYIITWSSDIPFSLKNQLHRLAIGINNSGLGLQIQDDFIAGETGTPII